MNTKLILSLATLVLVLASCRKDKVVQPGPQPVPVVNALSKVEYTNGDYDSIYYNADLQVIKLKSHTNAVVPFDQYYTFEYDANKKIARVNDLTGERYDYKYVNGELTSVVHYVNNTKMDFRMYDYTNGKLTGIEEYYLEGLSGPGYLLSSETELEYYADGNLKKETYYSFHPQTRDKFKHFSRTYSNYDTNNNTVDFMERYTYFSQVRFFKNNPGRMVSKDEVGGFETVYDFSYTYNDFLNPLTRKSRSAGGDVNVKYHYY